MCDECTRRMYKLDTMRILSTFYEMENKAVAAALHLPILRVDLHAQKQSYLIDLPEDAHSLGASRHH